jgi:hypothetical protein
MIILRDSVSRYGSPDFATDLSRELTALPEGSLPIMGEQGGLIDTASIGVTLLSAHADAGRIVVVIGVFFTELVGGCSCGDDPFSVSGYKELCLRIDRSDGAAVCVGRDLVGRDPE